MWELCCVALYLPPFLRFIYFYRSLRINWYYSNIAYFSSEVLRCMSRQTEGTSAVETSALRIAERTTADWKKTGLSESGFLATILLLFSIYHLSAAWAWTLQCSTLSHQPSSTDFFYFFFQNLHLIWWWWKEVSETDRGSQHVDYVDRYLGDILLSPLELFLPIKFIQFTCS